MSDVYSNPPAGETQYPAEPGFRPDKGARAERHPWWTAFWVALLVAAIAATPLWRRHRAARARSTPPQAEGEPLQQSPQPPPVPAAR